MPGSKSYTQRALVIAALAEGKSVLRNPLVADDTEHLMAALRQLGAGIRIRGETWIVNGTEGRLRNPDKEIHLGNNGTALRFLTTCVTLGRGVYVLTGDSRLCERPVKPLLDALIDMGVCAQSRQGGFPPIRIEAAGLPGGPVVLRNIESSQYVSSLLISAPYAARDTVIELRGQIPSIPYIEMTLETMKAFGVEAIHETSNRYIVTSGDTYHGIEYQVEADVSSASYFFLAAAVSGGKVRVEGINPKTLQGDIGLIEVLTAMGCDIVREEHSVTVKGGKLNSGTLVFDLGAMPDMVPTVAAAAALRPGKTVIRNVSHLRVKESDRLAALAAELNRIGIRAEESEDGIVIEGGNPHGAVIETYNDHRIAMSFAVLGSAVPGMKIKNRDCVNKSFPDFWEKLEKLRTDG